jgi:hypothetical protein
MSIPAILGQYSVYFNWLTREYEAFGSSTPTSPIQADTAYTVTLPTINESDSLQWQLPTLRVQPATTLANVNEVGFLWWNSETQRVERTATYEEYASKFSPTALNQTWQLNNANFTRFGNPFESRLVPYDGTNVSDVPYTTQGAYPQFFKGLVMTQAEWQALFDSADTVTLPGLGIQIEQWGDGVVVTTKADGTLGIESTATGGLLDIRIVAEASQWFWLTPLPELDEVAIYQASQRQTPERDTAPLPIPTPENSVGINSLSDVEEVNQSPTAPLPAEEDLTPNTQAPINSEVPAQALRQPAPSGLEVQGNNRPIEPLSKPFAPNQAEGTAPEAGGLPQLQSKPLLEARVIAPAPLSLPEDSTPEAGRAGNEGRLPIQPPVQDIKLINDDATSFNEDRLRAHRYDINGKGASSAEEQFLRKRAYENTPEIKRLKAEQLRAYAGL